MVGRSTRSEVRKAALCAPLCVPSLGGAALPVTAEAPAIAPPGEPIVPIPRRPELILQVRLGERLLRGGARTISDVAGSVPFVNVRVTSPPHIAGQQDGPSPRPGDGRVSLFDRRRDDAGSTTAARALPSPGDGLAGLGQVARALGQWMARPRRERRMRTRIGDIEGAR